jgi:hypothetical protein
LQNEKHSTEALPDYHNRAYKLTADTRGTLKISYGNKRSKTLFAFSQPIISAFEINHETNSLKSYLTSAFFTEEKDSKPKLENSYIGNFDGTFYVLSKKNFPFVETSSETLSIEENSPECNKVFKPLTIGFSLFSKLYCRPT